MTTDDEGLRRLLKQLPEVKPPEDLEQQVLKRVRDMSARPGRLQTWTGRFAEFFMPAGRGSFARIAPAAALVAGVIASVVILAPDQGVVDGILREDAPAQKPDAPSQNERRESPAGSAEPAEPAGMEGDLRKNKQTPVPPGNEETQLDAAAPEVPVPIPLPAPVRMSAKPAYRTEGASGRAAGLNAAIADSTAIDSIRSGALNDSLHPDSTGIDSTGIDSTGIDSTGADSAAFSIPDSLKH